MTINPSTTYAPLTESQEAAFEDFASEQLEASRGDTETPAEW